MAPTFPEEFDRGVLELLPTGSEPWLEVEIASASHSVARIRQVDLKLGKRLEVQLKLANADGVPLSATLHRPTPKTAATR